VPFALEEPEHHGAKTGNKMTRIDKRWFKRPDGLPERICAGGVVTRCEGDTVLVALVRQKGFGNYFLPKGHIEEGETLEKAARREVEEEAGFNQLSLTEELGVRERMDFRRTEWKVTHYFLFVTTQLRGEPTDYLNRYESRWFPVYELPAIFWPEQLELLASESERIVRLTKKHSKGE
jgi:ADP-ribose pyrophosphatase YjhB (NUDIX family)